VVDHLDDLSTLQQIVYLIHAMFRNPGLHLEPYVSLSTSAMIYAED
jgi:hypothetical protein